MIKSRFKIAFSLMELMMAFVALSVLLAAFTPIITKKLSKTASVPSSTANITEGAEQCTGKPHLFELNNDTITITEQLGKECNLCSVTETVKNTKIYSCASCLLEPKQCEDNQYIDVNACKCVDCSKKYKNLDGSDNTMCVKCNSMTCNECQWQSTEPYLDDGTTPNPTYCDPDTKYLDIANCACRNLTTTCSVPNCEKCDENTQECVTCSITECSEGETLSISNCQCVSDN